MAFSNLYDYLMERLDLLPGAARLVLVLDPGGKLNLSDEVANTQADVSSQTWKVIRYDGNDLAFRRQFNPLQVTLVWVTGPKIISNLKQIDLTSLVDIARRADAILDVSLLGILQSLFPNETWPAEPIAEFDAFIGNHLGIFIDSYKNLKPYLGERAALGNHSIRALVLACLQFGIQPVEFLFRVDSPVALLKKYVTLAWSFDWDPAGLQLLQKQAREASLLPLGGLTDWFEIDIQGLAQLIYFYRAFSLARIPNIINQIRGLGLLSFDPEPLEAGLGQVMILWEKDDSWRNRLIQNAEAELDLVIIHRAAGLLSADKTEPSRILSSLEMPALVYALTARLTEAQIKEGKIEDLLETWMNNRPVLLDQFDSISTPYVLRLQALACVLDESSFIQSCIAHEIATVSTLENLIKWYVQSRYYDLEFAHARAIMASARIKDESLRMLIQTMLGRLREQSRDYLDRADHVLAAQIRRNWHSYTTSSDLSANLLRDFVERPRLNPTDLACLWLIIFDGMRFDSWEAIVKPRLQQVFEIKKEKVYLSPLPTWTSIARTSITAGRTPDLWKGYRNTFTYNQALLAGKFFGLHEHITQQKLRFYSGMESDRTLGQFDRTRRYPYNILIFNISDDDLHKQRDHIGALNENIKSATDRILHFLDGLIQKDDTVIVTSDHGFQELDPGYAIGIKESNKWQRYMEGGEHPVRFRFIRSDDPVENIPAEHVLPFEWKMPDGKFVVAIGRHWFQREASKNVVRYDHGGLSFAEMVIPGVVMQPIREKKIDLRLEGLPTELQVDEGQPIVMTVSIVNRGNQPSMFDMGYSLDTDRGLRKISAQISPNGKSDVTLTLNPVILTDGKKTSKLTLVLNYVTIKGQTQTRRQDIPVTVIERKDVVQISLGGLDDLDI
ncbi:MAG: PglZ domain-containing protein [Bellilinea sp.]|jgi:hypothetical protein